MVIEDDLGNGRMVLDPGSISISPAAGSSCSTSGSPLVLDCTFGQIDPGASVTVAYRGTTRESDDLISPLSGQNSDPDVIRNVVSVTEFYAADNGGGHQFTTGTGVLRTYVYTPLYPR